MGSPAFRTEFSDTVRMFARDGVQSATLRLTPADLGQVDVQIRIVEGRAEVAIVAAPGAKEAIQDALPQLREALAQAGIQLGQADVGERSPSAFAGALDEQSARGQAGQPAGSAWDSATGASAERPGLPGRSAGARGLVDTYA